MFFFLLLINLLVSFHLLIKNYNIQHFRFVFLLYVSNDAKKRGKMSLEKVFYLNPSLCVYSRIRGAGRGVEEWNEVRLLIRSKDIFAFLNFHLLITFTLASVFRGQMVLDSRRASMAAFVREGFWSINREDSTSECIWNRLYFDETWINVCRVGAKEEKKQI
jgi:hypothetical protein